MEEHINIKKPNNVIREQLLIKKRVSIGPSIFEYPISYMTRLCIIQTPIVYIPYSTYKTDNKISLDFYFLNLEVDKEMTELKDFIVYINDMAIKHVRQKFPVDKKTKTKTKATAKEFISNIKQSQGCFNKNNNSKLKLDNEKMRVICYDNVTAFDDKKKPISLNYMKGKSYVKFLISPTKIWINKNKFGVLWEVLQVKIYPKTVLTSYMFLEDDSSSNAINNMSSHPKFKIYFDMVKKGVPKQAVKNKMLLDGFDPVVLDNPNSSSLNF